MDPLSSENLRSYLEHVMNAGLSERIISWRRIQSRGETAIAEYQQLKGRILEMEREIESRKQEVLLLEEELRRDEETHRKAMRTMKLLSDMTQHDIRLQLTVLDANIELCGCSVSDPRLTHIIRKEREITKTIEQKLSCIRSYRYLGTSPAEWQNVNKYAGITVTRCLPDRVSAAMDCPPDLEILADPLLYKVFENLRDNTLRNGEQLTEIRISSQQGEGGLVIAWEDNGVGIPPEQKEKIFSQGALWIDLLLTCWILDVTGITIRETGTYKKGARFEMTVPEGAYRFMARSDAKSG
jgi:signal transduction histidine kinase